MFIDTHAHLYWDSFKEDFNEVIEKCLAANVEKIINIGVDIETSRIAARMESTKVKFYSSIGIHPHEATKYLDNPDVSIQRDMEELEKIYNQNPQKVILIGECGLDYLIESQYIPEGCTLENVKELQKKLLAAQIKLAKKLNLPLSIHVRDNRSEDPDNSECWNEILDLTKDHFGIFHCYSGLAGTTSRIKETGFLVSFAATITYPKNEYLREAAKNLSLEKVVLETDCPFLPPQSNRGQRNDPSTVKEIAGIIADLKNIDLNEAAKQTTLNVERLLNI